MSEAPMTVPPDFIPPNIDVGNSHSWREHFATCGEAYLRQRWNSQLGVTILKEWEKGGYERSKLVLLVGTFFGQLDLRGAPLANKDLQKKDLSHIDFFGANLSGCSLQGADLSDSHLSRADIRGADFSWCRMKNTFLDDAKFDVKTQMLGVNLNSINFNFAILLQEQAHTQQRIADLKHRYPILATALKYTCDYGRSLRLWFFWVAGIILLFGGTFGLVPGLITTQGHTGAPGLMNGIYFSWVTFTTLGYGDWVPCSVLGQLLTMADVSLGYLMGGLLVAILARKVMGS